MKLFLSRKGKKLHSVIWMLDATEASSLDDERGSLLRSSDGIAKINAFLSAKDAFSLITSMESFGAPLSHREILLDSSFGAEAFRMKRSYLPEEFIEEKVLSGYTSGSRGVLAAECWFLVAGSGSLPQEKESAARRSISSFGFADDSDLREAAKSCRGGGLIVVEPLLDWVWLKNMVVLMLSLKHSLESGCADPLTSCGFRKTSVTDFGLAKPLDSAYEAFVIPVAFNEYWRNTKVTQLMSEDASYCNPLRGDGFLSWAPYSKLGFESVNGPLRSVVRMKDDGCGENRAIRYVSDNQVDGKPGTLLSFRDDWGGNLYLAITGDIDDERLTAEYFFNTVAKNRMKHGWIDCDFALDSDRDGGLTARTLESQIWLTLLGQIGIRVGICERCGLPFLAKGRARKLYCSHNCLQMAKKEGRTA